MPATSEPPPGSVTASEPIFSPASVGRTKRVDLLGRAVGGDVRQRDPAGEQTRPRARRTRPPRRTPPASPPSRAASRPARRPPRGRRPRAARPSRRRGAATAGSRRRPPTPGGAARPPGVRTRGWSPAGPAARRSSVTAAPPGSMTSRERSHSPSALACGSKRVLAATPSPSRPWSSTLTPSRLGSAKISTSSSSASGTSSRTRSTVRNCRSHWARSSCWSPRPHPEADVGVAALVAGAGVHEGAERQPAGDRVVGHARDRVGCRSCLRLRVAAARRPPGRAPPRWCRRAGAPCARPRSRSTYAGR